LITLAIDAIVIGGSALWIGSRWSPAIARRRDAVVAVVHGPALWLAAAVGVGSVVASLYYSEIANFAPCSLCWYGRIAMYPLALVLVIAAFRDDRSAGWYAIPMAIAGFGINLYNYALHVFPELDSRACSVTVPCSTPYVWEFGFISIPFMGLGAFALVLLLLGVAGSSQKGSV
jgi:disulfide bond formation protein DsbB